MTAIVQTFKFFKNDLIIKISELAKVRKIITQTF